MRLARMHRRLAGFMALSAVAALAAGAGVTPAMALVAGALLLQLFWTPPARIAALVERGARLVALGLFAWVLYIGLIAGGDILTAGIGLLFVLLVGEVLRPLDAKNDFRLYSLSFALIIASTAFYPGVGFALAFTAYIVFTTLALMVGHLRRQAEEFRIADLRINRSFLAVTAALSGITLLSSVVIFVTFPRLPRTWFGQGRTPAGSMAGFSDVVSIGEHGSRLRGNPEVMFRVEFGEGAPSDVDDLYWRGLSFDRFDGERWSRSRDAGRASRGFFGTFPLHARWGPETRRYRIFGGPEGVRVLFGQHPVMGVRPHSAIRPRFAPNGDLLYDGWDAPVYTVESGPTRPSESRLRASGGGEPPAAEQYRQLPNLAPRVAQLADSLTRPYQDRIDRVRAVERWLQTEFRYTLDLPRTRGETSLEHFLFERRAGHCEYFSTAMAVLLRSAGIPARNVNGFLGGEWNARAEYLAVTGNNAHSWVEVWFPELGWVPFDPTPAADRREMLSTAASSPVWPMLFWLDGVQFQWHRWVLAYDLERQIGLLRSIGERFERGPSAGHPDPVDWGATLPWLVVFVGAAGVVWIVVRRRGDRHAIETRLYLDLRRSYARAGYPVRHSDPPLGFLERLRAAGAPELEGAEWMVGRYLRARFAGEPLEPEEHGAMRARLASVRRALRG